MSTGSLSESMALSLTTVMETTSSGCVWGEPQSGSVEGRRKSREPITDSMRQMLSTHTSTTQMGGRVTAAARFDEGGTMTDEVTIGANTGAATATSSARSRSGAIAVTTTAQGLPLAVRIDESQLAKAPQVLADDVLRLCKQSAMAAGVRLRAQLAASGMSPEVLESLDLPQPDDLARVEQADDATDDAPTSWLRSV